MQTETSPRNEAKRVGRKTDLKKELKRLFAPPTHPVLVEVPEMTFLMIDGAGAPEGSQEYVDAIRALYSVSYGVKFALKRNAGLDYTVMPLEGLWWRGDGTSFGFQDEEPWRWTAMILQPPEVTPEAVRVATAEAWQKHELLALWKLRLENLSEGIAAQIMHVGPYAAERPTIEVLHAFIEAEGYVPHGKHHEIYLGDPRRTAPERLKTVIRQPVAVR
jgi:hypothetical protein